MLNSASLLADAGHSLSGKYYKCMFPRLDIHPRSLNKFSSQRHGIDMLSDFVTLYTYKRSRKPSDALYPYGYGKFGQ
jgi:divalent metal cation (Fe/Co/Zn/Cd) transporter